MVSARSNQESGGIINNMNTFEGFICSLVVFGMFFLGITFGNADGFSRGYKQGQIDAINGKIFYKLETKTATNYVRIN